MTEITRKQQYTENKHRIEYLSSLDPFPDTVQGQELERLVFEVAEYEKEVVDEK